MKSITKIEDANPESSVVQYRDESQYKARNLIGSLLRESEKLFSSLDKGHSIDELRNDVIYGNLFTQKALLSRKRFWNMLVVRYLKSPEWVIDDLLTAYRRGPHSEEFLSLLYLHYALSDHFTFDFIAKHLWKKWKSRDFIVSKDDLMKVIDDSAHDHPQMKKCSYATKEKLSSIILTSLRDFKILSGKQKKHLIKPVLPLFTVEHILHILILEGAKGNEVLTDPIWHLFFCSTDEIAHYFHQLELNRIIRFERVGNTVVLQTPAEWEG